MSVWRFNVNKNTRDKANYIIDHKIVSAGWSFKSEYDAKNKKPVDKKISADEFDKMVKRSGWGKGTNKKLSAQPIYEILAGHVRKGDYVWLYNPRDDNYYLGKISDTQMRLVQNEDTINYDIGTQIKVEEYKKIGPADKIPGYLTITNTRRVIRRIASDAVQAQRYSEYKWNDYGADFKIKSSDLFSYIGPDAMEDLIYAYLHHKYNYEIIPSTNKRSTPTFEFIMKNQDNKKITLQVKNGGKKNLKVSKYIQYLNTYKEIYLFTRDGNVIPTESTKILSDVQDLTGLFRLTKVGDNEHELKRVASNTDLVEFASNPENRWVLPDVISEWVNCIDDIDKN